MSDDAEFMTLTNSLWTKDFLRRIVLVHWLRRSLVIAVVCLALVALAVLIALTNTTAVVITLAIIAIIALEVGRLGLREYRRGSQ